MHIRLSRGLPSDNFLPRCQEGRSLRTRQAQQESRPLTRACAAMERIVGDECGARESATIRPVSVCEYVRIFSSFSPFLSFSFYRSNRSVTLSRSKPRRARSASAAAARSACVPLAERNTESSSSSSGGSSSLWARVCVLRP